LEIKTNYIFKSESKLKKDESLYKQTKKTYNKIKTILWLSSKYFENCPNEPSFSNGKMTGKYANNCFYEIL
jgi:hypothetical protein